MANPFNNFKELLELIKSGKTNDEIINERIEYLTSVEYKKNHTYICDEFGSHYFDDGFLDDKFVDIMYSVNGKNIVEDIEYFPFHSIKGRDFYYEVLDAIRRSINIVNTSNITTYIYRYVINYLGKATEKITSFFVPIQELQCEIKEEDLRIYKKNNNSETNKNYDYYVRTTETEIKVRKEKIGKIPSNARDVINNLLSLYSSSSFDGSLIEYVKAKLIHETYPKESLKEKKEYLELEKKYVESLKNKSQRIIVDISDMKGYGVGECFERSMLAQNLLIFFGFEAYRLGGHIGSNIMNQHSFNVIVSTVNPTNFYIFDTAQRVFSKIPEVKSVDDLKNMDGIETINEFDKTVLYTTTFVENKKNNQKLS